MLSLKTQKGDEAKLAAGERDARSEMKAVGQGNSLRRRKREWFIEIRTDSSKGR